MFECECNSKGVYMSTLETSDKSCNYCETIYSNYNSVQVKGMLVKQVGFQKKHSLWNDFISKVIV